MSIEELKEMIDNGKYPIIHPNKNLQECLTCCPIDDSYLAQCTHYLILVSYTPYDFVCKIITKTPKYDNIKVNNDQYELTLTTMFFGESIRYYSSSTYFMTFSCIRTTSYKGYFKYL
jgi:hypothetical protein